MFGRKDHFRLEAKTTVGGLGMRVLEVPNQIELSTE